MWTEVMSRSPGFESRCWHSISKTLRTLKHFQSSIEHWNENQNQQMKTFEQETCIRQGILTITGLITTSSQTKQTFWLLDQKSKMKINWKLVVKRRVEKGKSLWLCFYFFLLLIGNRSMTWSGELKIRFFLFIVSQNFFFLYRVISSKETWREQVSNPGRRTMFFNTLKA